MYIIKYIRDTENNDQDNVFVVFKIIFNSEIDTPN